MKYTKEILEEAVSLSKTFSEVCDKLGCKRTGGSYYHIHKKIKEYQIDTSHFLTRTEISKLNYQNTLAIKKRTPASVFVDGYDKRVPGFLLRRCLIESGINYCCNICNINNWNNKYILLHVDHIDGDWSNCKINNLRFLCPNCHSQTSTFGMTKQNKCKCGVKIKSARKYCNSCLKTVQQSDKLLNNPTVEEIKNGIWNYTVKGYAIRIGVSECAVRKWCKKYNIQKPPRGYYRKLSTELVKL